MQANRRILYLDSLRAFVMSLGVILHAGMFDRFWFSDGVSYASGLFRMKLFVFIAGFFATMLHDKRGFPALRRERMFRFGVPCVLFILLVNPVANLYAYRSLVGPLTLADYLSPGFRWPVDTPDRINWHQHLWFLIVVLVYCLAMPLFLRVAKTRAVRGALDCLGSDRIGESFRLLALAVAMTLLFVGGRTLHFLLFQRYLADGPLNFLVQAILWYWPYFLLGLVAFRDRRLFDLMHRAPLWQVGLAAGALALSVAGYYPVRLHFGKAAAETVQHLGESVAGFYLCVLLLMLFSRYANVENRTIRFLSDASYTVYLLHFSLVAILGYYIAATGVGPLATYTATIAVVYATCLLVHRYVVESSPLLRLVFNGRVPAPKTGAPGVGVGGGLQARPALWAGAIVGAASVGAAAVHFGGRHGAVIAAEEQIVLPSAERAPDRTGFPITGLTIVGGAAWAGNDGRVRRGYGSRYSPTLVQLSPDLSRIRREIVLPTNSSVQGLAFVDGRLWFVLPSLKAIGSTALQPPYASRIEARFAFEPNGLAFDRRTRTFIVSEEEEGMLRFYRRFGGEPIETVRLSIDPDQLTISGNKLLFSSGENGTPATVGVVDLDNGHLEGTWHLPDSRAIEGLAIYKGDLLVADAAFANRTAPQQNRILRYRLPV